MRKQPKVSVIIPFYNRKRHIKDCLLSVRSSTLRNIEIICVDDGSTDDTYDYLCRLASRDRRITVLKTEHKGPYEARWVGLRHSRGEYIHFMDSDDVIVSDAYEECYEICQKNQLDYLVFRCAPFTDENHNEREAETSMSFAKHYTLSENCCGKCVSGIELMHSLMAEKSFYVGLPMRIIRRSIICEDDFDLCKAFYHADNFYSFHWLSIADRAMAINKILYKRRVHRNSITMSKGVEETHTQSILQVIIALIKSISRNKCLERIGPNYLIRLARGLNRHMTHLSSEEVDSICQETMECETQDARNLTRFLVIPLIRKI